MALGIASLIIIAVGTLLIISGLGVSLTDWNRKSKARQGVTTEGLALGDEITALAKLADALKGYPMGMQLIFLGIVVLIVGGLIGGVGAL